jgi:hypothetical protein
MSSQYNKFKSTIKEKIGYLIILKRLKYHRVNNYFNFRNIQNQLEQIL